jgi:protein phosphatase
MNFALGNAQHAGSREQQQDAFGFSNPSDADFVRHGGLLAVLADGMGGLAHGDMASRVATNAFLAAYKQKPVEETIPDALARSLRTANEAVCELAMRFGATGELGTTLVASVLHDQALHWISVGDSALFLHRDGQFTQLSASHTYARELDAKAAAGVITKEAAEQDAQREALTSHLGLPDLPEIDRSPGPLPIEESDCVLLASDGLFKTLAPGEMAAVMTGDLQRRCDALVERVLAAGAAGQDNVTVIAVGLPHTRREPVLLPATPSAGGHWRWAVVLTALLASLLAAAGAFRYLMVTPETKAVEQPGPPPPLPPPDPNRHVEVQR